MSQVTEQSVRLQTALASIKLIHASAVLDLTEDDFDFLTSNKVWIATDRSRARRCVFFFSSRRLHTICYRDWSSDVCSSDLTCFNAERTGRLIATDSVKPAALVKLRFQRNKLKLDRQPRRVRYGFQQEEVMRVWAKFRLLPLDGLLLLAELTACGQIQPEEIKVQGT